MQDQDPRVITISELNRRVRYTLEKQLPSCWVTGEISNLTKATSGHWYFTLKDRQSSARCVMFRGRNQFVDWSPREGEQIEIRAQPTLFEPRGDFQLVVDAMRHAGVGRLFEEFLRLKHRLELEGLFDQARKRALPNYPFKIGIVTSIQGAALHDVLRTLYLRWPAARIFIYPAQVQGEGAADQIASALLRAGADGECEVILLVRGGGSLEDQWPFNEEMVARAIAASPIAVVSGVGHETDFCIADFVADVRAPTPTGAAQQATPDRAEISSLLKQQEERLAQAAYWQINHWSILLDSVQRRLKHPRENIEVQRQEVRRLTRRCAQLLSMRHMEHKWRCDVIKARLLAQRPPIRYLASSLLQARSSWMGRIYADIESRRERIRALNAHLMHLNPTAVMERGYGIVRNAKGNVITDASELRLSELVTVNLAKGHFEAQVSAIGADQD